AVEHNRIAAVRRGPEQAERPVQHLCRGTLLLRSHDALPLMCLWSVSTSGRLVRVEQPCSLLLNPLATEHHDARLPHERRRGGRAADALPAQQRERQALAEAALV